MIYNSINVINSLLLQAGGKFDKYNFGGNLRMVFYQLYLGYPPFLDVFGRTKDEIAGWYDAVCSLFRSGNRPIPSHGLESIDEFAVFLGKRPFGFSDRRTLDLVERVDSGKFYFDFWGSGFYPQKWIELPVSDDFKAYFLAEQIDAFLDFQKNHWENRISSLYELHSNKGGRMDLFGYVPEDVYQEIRNYPLQDELVRQCQTELDSFVLESARNPHPNLLLSAENIQRSAARRYGEGKLNVIFSMAGTTGKKN